MSVMFITHDFGVVAEIADRVVVMEKGYLVEQGRADQVLINPVHPYTQRLVAAVPRMRSVERSIDEEVPVVLEVENLEKEYRSSGSFFRKARTVKAVNNVSFKLRKDRPSASSGKADRANLPSDACC